jgi:hypothetical protein
MHTSNERKLPVRPSSPTLKRVRLADDIGQRISKATVGSFSRGAKDDGARSTMRGQAEPASAPDRGRLTGFARHDVVARGPAGELGRFGLRS